MCEPRSHSVAPRIAFASPRYSLTAVPENHCQRILERARIGCERGGRQAHSAHGPPAGSAVLLSQQCDTTGCVHACMVRARPLVHHTVGRVHCHPPQCPTQHSWRKLRKTLGQAWVTHGAHASLLFIAQGSAQQSLWEAARNSGGEGLHGAWQLAQCVL